MVVLLHVTEPAQATLAAQVLGAQPASGPAFLALDFVFQRQSIKLFPFKVFLFSSAEKRGSVWEASAGRIRARVSEDRQPRDPGPRAPAVPRVATNGAAIQTHLCVVLKARGARCFTDGQTEAG